MFFKQVWRSAIKHRKDNGLFFGSLIIAIVAFYTLLSLKEQDVMRYLATIESVAVSKLLRLIPLVYMISLFFVFFLVYFACKYQADSRRKEFGMYLMLGMKYRRLFTMLFFETLLNSLISLLMGIPFALFLTEGISLLTAKLVGLGIIGHHISFSFTALLYTICGFVLVQLLSVVIICMDLAHTEPAEFMADNFVKEQEKNFQKNGIFSFFAGAFLLLMAYATGILFLKSFDFLAVFIIFLFGTLGTFFFFKGLGSMIGRGLKRKSGEKAGLSIFTARQLQENVLCQHKALAVASLLLLLSLSCISFGIGMTAGSHETRTTDLSVKGTEAEMQDLLSKEEVSSRIETSYPVYLSYSHVSRNLDPLKNALGKLPQSDLRDNMMENITDSSEYIISESSYNQLLSAIGKEPISLGSNQMALFSSEPVADFTDIMNDALKQNVRIEVDGTEYSLLPWLYQDNIVTNRMISLYAALIVPDEVFEEIADNPEPFCYNLHLNRDTTEKQGLLGTLSHMGKILSSQGLEYSSYLGGIGRNLFYTVASSYLTLYLGILFLLIANTVMGLKYLIWQRQNKHRYVTLMMLGADKKSLCMSVRSQIQTFFNLILFMTVINGIFAIFSMFGSFLRLPSGSSLTLVLLMSAIAFVLFILTEFVYIYIVKRTACNEIMELKPFR